MFQQHSTTTSPCRIHAESIFGGLAVRGHLLQHLRNPLQKFLLIFLGGASWGLGFLADFWQSLGRNEAGTFWEKWLLYGVSKDFSMNFMKPPFLLIKISILGPLGGEKSVCLLNPDFACFESPLRFWVGIMTLKYVGLMVASQNEVNTHVCWLTSNFFWLKCPWKWCETTPNRLFKFGCA